MRHQTTLILASTCTLLVATDACPTGEPPEPILVADVPVYKLLEGYDSSDAFEASGITYANGYLYVVFDNREGIAQIDPSLPINDPANTIIGDDKARTDYEGITFDDYKTANFYIVEEAKEKDGAYYPRVLELDGDLDPQGETWVDIEMPSGNHGIEGIAWLRYDADDYLLLLEEESGMVHVVQQSGDEWVPIASMQVPIAFDDYSDIALLDGHTVAVTSDESHAFWVGTLEVGDPWRFADAGVEYLLPDSFEALEGITWLDADTVATCTDIGGEHGESVQVFELP